MINVEELGNKLPLSFSFLLPSTPFSALSPCVSVRQVNALQTAHRRLTLFSEGVSELAEASQVSQLK